MLTRLFSTICGAGIGLAIATAVPAHAADDVEAKAQPCAACHGQNGVPTDPKTIPIIWGQEASYIFKQLRDYRNGERSSPIMAPIAKDIKEEDLRSGTSIQARISALSASVILLPQVTTLKRRSSAGSFTTSRWLVATIVVLAERCA